MVGIVTGKCPVRHPATGVHRAPSRPGTCQLQLWLTGLNVQRQRGERGRWLKSGSRE